MNSGDLEPTQRSTRGPDGSGPGGGDLPDIPEITLTEEIGRGGMGVVYRGRQEYLDRDVAVKLLIVDPGDRDYAARFQREAKILAGLSHPNIVTCYSAGITTDGKPYLAMEFIDGPNLRQWLDKCGPVAPRLALEILRDLAEALRHGYRSKIIHRDVKPENVLLTRKVSAPVGVAFPYEVKLADLGLARSVMRDDTMMNLTSSREVLGTPPMMAPEQFDESSAIDHRSDIYGLGCVLYQSLTGQFAYSGRSYAAIIAKKQAPRGPDPRSLNPDIPEAVATLVTEMLARDPDDRPQAYEVLIRRIDNMITAIDSGLDLPSQAGVFHDGQTQVLERAPTAVSESAKRSLPRAWIAIGLLVLIVVSIGIASLWRPKYRVLGLRRVTEMSPISLELDGVGPETASVLWTVTGSDEAPPVATPLAGDRVDLMAPNGSAAYQLEFVWVAKPTDGGESATGATTVRVAAQNDPPTVSVPSKLSAAAGETKVIEAVGIDPEGEPVTEFVWSLIEPVDGLTVPVTRSSQLSLALPPRDEAYIVSLSVTPIDGRGLRGEPCPVTLDVEKTRHPLTVDVKGATRTREGRACRLEVVAEGGNPRGRTYRWQQLSGRTVSLDFDSARPTCSISVPSRLPALETIQCEAIVSDVEPANEVRAVVSIEIEPDPEYLPIMSTAGESLFEAPIDTILKSWKLRGQKFDKTSYEDGVMGSGRRGAESSLTREMPCGGWLLAGVFDDVMVPQPARQHGIEIEVVDRRHFVRFAVTRSEDRLTRRLSIYEREIGSDGKWTQLDRPEEELSKSGYLHFRLLYRDGAIEFQYHDHPKDVYTEDFWNKERLDLSRIPNRNRPRLAIFVDGDGVANFREFTLGGVEER